jgi:hypothetical protein
MSTTIAPGVAGITFPVADVKLATTLRPETQYREAVEQAIGSPLESCTSRLHHQLVATPYNGFLRTVESAFSYHQPLSLSPDHIWLAVCQGFANHVNVNAEALRSRFVNFEGKEKIVVRRDSFVRKAFENDWENVWPEFVLKMKEYIGEKADLFMPDFSTTGPVETAAAQVTLMDAMQNYFEYTVRTCCGIPSVTLEGQGDDWRRLRDRVQAFADYDCGWWFDHLNPVLDQLVESAAGNPDREWWKGFFNEGGGSGGPYLTGYMMAFFPYIVSKEYQWPNGYSGVPTRKVSLVRNTELGKARHGRSFGGLGSDDFPPGCALAPFVWDYYGTNFDYDFVAGFVGTRQDHESMTLRPEIGWAVRESNTAAA